jgi:hypothetical protein
MGGVSKIKQYNYSESVDYGYIVIPTKVDRDGYVATCYKRERVTIQGANGAGQIKDCYISRSALKDIDFPKDSNELGVAVAYIVNTFNNKPIIVGRVSKEAESQLLEEGEFRLEKSYNNSKVSVTGKAKTGDLLIDVENNDGTGALIINVTGKEDGSSLKINVKGDATIYSDDTLNLETVGVVNVKSIDENDETKFSIIKVTNNNVNITPVEDGTFTVSEGSEPILLGEKTVTELNKELDISKAITTIINGAPVLTTAVGTPDGLYVALKAAITGKTHGNYSNVKSEISFTD